LQALQCTPFDWGRVALSKMNGIAFYRSSPCCLLLRTPPKA